MPNKLDRILAFAQTKPDDPFVWYSLAMEQKKSDLAAAIETFEKVRREHPRYLPNYYQLGTTLAEDAEDDRAREVLEAGLALAKETGDAHTASELTAALDAL